MFRSLSLFFLIVVVFLMVVEHLIFNLLKKGKKTKIIVPKFSVFDLSNIDGLMLN